MAPEYHQTSAPSIPACQTKDPNPGDEYKWSVAKKKLAWSLSKLAAAKLLALGSLPVVLSAWGSISAWLQAHGITVIIDQKVFAAALPGAVFGLLVLNHDYFKVQYPDLKWL